MTMLHVITDMQKAAGSSVFCGEVCNGLVSAGHCVTIAVVNPAADNCYSTDRRIAITSISSIVQGASRFDLVHIHALWSPILHKVARWARANKIPVVWSPHGMLTPWAFRYKWWKKLPAWWVYQKRDLQKADLLHVTADSETEDVRRMGLKNKVIVAPLGARIDEGVEHVEHADEKRVLLFVSRIQKKKGLPNLVRAWADLSDGVKHGWKVRIVGPDQENHTAELKLLCGKFGVSQDFAFVGPKYGDDLQHEYASADLFVLPTNSENFGSVVIEAMAHKVPVITTKGAPWSDLEERKCGWWIDIGEKPLVVALAEALSMSDEARSEMGLRGRRLVEDKYTWSKVVEKMLAGYEDVF